MRFWLRGILLLLFLLCSSSFFWFVYNATAHFQRGMDLIGTFILVGGGLPILLLAVMFITLLVKGWTPKNSSGYVGICIGAVLSIVLGAALMNSVSEYEWAKVKIKSDTLKITADGLYEYRIDLINLFQRNSNSRLYVKDRKTKQEKFLQVDIRTNKIGALGVSEHNHWVHLEPANHVGRYILNTTKDLGIAEEKFEVDLVKGTLRRLE